MSEAKYKKQSSELFTVLSGLTVFVESIAYW